MAARVLSLPMSPYLSDSDIHTVAAAVLQATGAGIPGESALLLSA
jgi:dTDP-4-amino-4,6-dideoxygalactose transaminase